MFNSFIDFPVKIVRARGNFSFDDTEFGRAINFQNVRSVYMYRYIYIFICIVAQLSCQRTGKST